MATALMSVLPIAGARAANLVNQDDEEHEIVVITGEGAEVIVVAPKETIEDVCGACVIELGDDNSVEVTLKIKTVNIKEGKLSANQ